MRGQQFTKDRLYNQCLYIIEAKLNTFLNNNSQDCQHPNNTKTTLYSPCLHCLYFPDFFNEDRCAVIQYNN